MANFPESVVKLARQKANELEDFGGVDKHMDDDFPAEVTDEGIEIVEAVLRSWSSKKTSDGEDIVMLDSLEEDIDNQLGEVRRCVEELRPQIEGNAWLKKMLVGL
ncbi:hypothetical protein MPER_02361 [Moniliophthora perniciosa FA553]|nr:hypothetical protein MPER_02361 [Moniliophthora perniciosa FA553]